MVPSTKVEGFHPNPDKETTSTSYATMENAATKRPTSLPVTDVSSGCDSVLAHRGHLLRRIAACVCLSNDQTSSFAPQNRQARAEPD